MTSGGNIKVNPTNKLWVQVDYLIGNSCWMKKKMVGILLTATVLVAAQPLAYENDDDLATGSRFYNKLSIV